MTYTTWRTPKHEGEKVQEFELDVSFTVAAHNIAEAYALLHEVIADAMDEIDWADLDNNDQPIAHGIMGWGIPEDQGNRVTVTQREED